MAMSLQARNLNDNEGWSESNTSSAPQGNYYGGVISLDQYPISNETIADEARQAAINLVAPIDPGATVAEEAFEIDVSLGDFYYYAQDYSKAITHYNQARNTFSAHKLNILSKKRVMMEKVNQHLITAYSTQAEYWAQQKDYAKGIDAYKQTLYLARPDKTILFKLGYYFYQLHIFDQACFYFNRLHRLHPEFTDVYIHLGNAYLGLQQFYKAQSYYEEYLDLKSGDQTDDIDICLRLSEICGNSAQWDKAIVYAEKVTRVQPENSIAASMIPRHAIRNHHLNQADIFLVTQKAMDTYCDAISTTSPHDPPDIGFTKPSYKIRLNIGYLSGDFGNHTLMRFMMPFLTHHDRDRFAVHCFANNARPDGLPQGIIDEHDLRYFDISQLSDKAAADLIRSTGIDILIDLGGHTPASRLLAMVHKAAPIQVTYLGYPNTSGLRTIDYILTDRLTIFENESHLFTETPFYLEAGYEALDIPAVAKKLPITPPPFVQNDYITFGFFSAPSKINPLLISQFARIINALPRAKLFIHRQNIPEERIHDFKHQFQKHGIDAQCLMISDENFSHEIYSQVDIALDAFPYNGTATTIDCLVQGVPVICVYGDGPHGRSSARILSQVGLPKLIAQNSDEFVSIAVKLAYDAKRLISYRQTLRQRVEESPLCDQQGFTRALEAAYRKMWSTWCEIN